MNGVVSGKTVLVTGAGGSIGSALTKAIVRLDPRHLILLDHSEPNLHQINAEFSAFGNHVSYTSVLGDICDAKLLSEVFQRYRPEIVYHAAAFKHVPLMENNPFAAIRNNVMGTDTLAKMAQAAGVTIFVMVSTDKAVNPISIMGASKRVAELVLLRLDNPKNHMSAIRLGNVLGSEGSVVPTFLDQISRGGPVTVTHPEICRYFVTIREAVELVLLTSTLAERGGIFIPQLGSPVKILDMARQLISDVQSKSRKDISIVFTGLRTGDKMSEEFLFSHESPEPTSNQKLSRVRATEVLSTRFEILMEDLARSVDERNLSLLMETLCQIVPEYRPTEVLQVLQKASAV